MPKKYVHGIELYYEMTGQGQPLLFIHGLGSSTRDWENQVPLFAQQYRVITVDIRGHGQSDKPRGGYSMAIFAADIAELLRSLNCAPAHIVGLSLGGSIAFELAVMAPDLVRSLTIVNSAPGVPPKLQYRLLQIIAYIQRWLVVRLQGMRKMGEVLGERLLPEPEQEERRHIFIERWAENDKNAYLASFKTLIGWSVADQLGKIRCPTLVVTAEEDYTPLAYKEAYVSQMPDAQLVVIENSRHLTPIDQSEKFNATLIAFLQQLFTDEHKAPPADERTPAASNTSPATSSTETPAAPLEPLPAPQEQAAATDTPPAVSDDDDEPIVTVEPPPAPQQAAAIDTPSAVSDDEPIATVEPPPEVFQQPSEHSGPFTTLISPEDLAKNLEDPHWAIFDCRFELQDPSRGRRDYDQAHIPGALYAHLDTDLAGPIISSITGRHPLPDAETFARKLSEWGIDETVQVVVYDDMGGALAAARLWWMLRWLGHQAVAVLDGGWQAWQNGGYPFSSQSETRPPSTFVPRPREGVMLATQEVMTLYNDPTFRLFDVRKPPRYRGEVEPMDPVAGHIPGAISAPFEGNLDEDGHFLPVERLRERYQALLGDFPAEQTAFYCGSGATSAHSILAMLHAGLGEARLYVGSWSEWAADQSRPVEKGG